MNLMDRHEYVLSKIRPTDTVLHVGCTGNDWEYEERWAGRPLHVRLKEKAKDVRGIDILPGRIAQMVSEGHYAIVGDAEHMVDQLPDTWEKSFDVVVAGELIEHLTNPAAFLEGCKHFLKHGGRLVLTTPNMVGFWSFYTYGLMRRRETHSEHVTGFKEEFLKNMLSRHGWKILDIAHTQTEHLGKRRMSWLKEIPERICPRLRPIVGVTAQVA